MATGQDSTTRPSGVEMAAASALLRRVRAFYADPENRRRFEEWLRARKGAAACEG